MNYINFRLFIVVLAQRIYLPFAAAPQKMREKPNAAAAPQQLKS
jgi:hypothetical protein